MSEPEFSDTDLAAANRLIRLALDEDLGGIGDLTSESLVNADETGTVEIVVRESGVICGLRIVERVFAELDSAVIVEIHAPDSARVESGTTVATVSGPLRAILTGERTVLNFLTHLSGIATLTRRFVDAISGTRAEILDTRKTLPGYRRLQKYAVRCGGGTNHRMGLYDAVMIKDNHVAAWSAHASDETLVAAVRAARETISRREVTGLVVVEVDRTDQLADALDGSPDTILLDNMTPSDMRHCVSVRDSRAPHVLLEASGGVTLETVRDAAETGVDRISVGHLTHSAAALDIGFDWPGGN